MSIDMAPRQHFQEGTPEKYELPRVTEKFGVPAAVIGISEDLAPANIMGYRVEDPFLKQIPNQELDHIRAQENFANAIAQLRRTEGKWQRMPGTAYEDGNGQSHTKSRIEWGDPYSSEAFFGNGEFGLKDPALRAWLTRVPTAAALAYLSDPFNVRVVEDRRGNKFEATETTQKWLAACTDAIGIRSRAAGMAEQVNDYIALHRLSNPNEPVTMMSIACGTALPTLQAAMRAGATDARLLLIDKDKKSMDLTYGLAGEVGFEGEIATMSTDIFDPTALAALKESLTANGQDNRPHLVDAMGIFEYTSKELRGPDAKDDPSLLYDPAKFLRAGFDLVRPGGRFIFGQMRNDRPNADFTMGVVRWPYVCMRSPKEVMEIVKEAGIDPSWVTLNLTPEGVYAIASIDKPVEELPQAEAAQQYNSSEVAQSALAKVSQKFQRIRTRIAGLALSRSAQQTAQ